MRFTAIEELISRFEVNPSNAALYYIILAFAILISLILHECGHGLVAYWCGDPTAKMLGRLTLNPAKHLDPIGTVCMLLFRFGWAKPVPINPRNFRHYRRDYAFVSLAGITVNLILFVLFMGISVLVNQALWNEEILRHIEATELFSLPMSAVSSGQFALSGYFIGDVSALPPTVTGLMNVPALMYLQFFFQIMASINLSLAVFNFLPIPPLDGFRVLDSVLLRGRVQITQQAYQIIRIVTLVLLLTGLISRLMSLIISPVYNAVFRFFVWVFGLA